MNKFKTKYFPIIVSILIPLSFGLFGYLIGSTYRFNGLIKPTYAPPMILFPIVWTILYILMGISSYLIYKSDTNKEKKQFALGLYAIQLILNSLWTFIFFTLKLYLFGFIWILIMIFFVIAMIIAFYKIKPIAAYLQIPYLLWLIFASVLSYSIFLLN